MNWSRLYFQKEAFGTLAYKKVEWTAQLVEVEGAKFDAGFPEGGKATKVGHGRCELESVEAFAPEAHGNLRVIAGDQDYWGEFANDRFAFSGGDENLRVRLDEPSVTVDGKPEIVFERPRGKGNVVLCGASRGDRFLGYVPAALKSGGVMSFIFGSSAQMPWFVPASQPWGGKKLIEGTKVPPEMGKALADPKAWDSLAGDASFFPAILAARILFAALQSVRYG